MTSAHLEMASKMGEFGPDSGGRQKVCIKKSKSVTVCVGGLGASLIIRI